jgi:hypothetical protein
LLTLYRRNTDPSISEVGPIGVTSGLFTLATFLLQAVKTLYQAVDSFQSHIRPLRELKEELKALSGLLESLQMSVTSGDVDLAVLKLPLLRCGKACEDFQTSLTKLKEQSRGAGPSLRDWARLQYMGEDITEFKNMLGGYRATIGIALSGVNM